MDLGLSDLDAFVAVAQERSFRGAAALRGVSASSLSEAMRRLEARLGVRLVNRTTRSVTPTEAGQRLLERLRPALNEVSQALDAVNHFRERPAGTLRLNVPTVVAARILPPILARFLERYPEISAEVSANDAFIDVLAAGFDAGVRYDESLEQDMIAVPLGPMMQRFVLAAAPVYLEKHGVPKHPRELLAHACIRHRFANGVSPSWEFEKAGEIVKISPQGPLVSNMLELRLAAATAGLGLIFMFEDYLGPYLESGALQPVLSDWWPSFSGPYLYYPSRVLMPAPLRAFVDFIKEDGGKKAKRKSRAR